MPVKPSPVAFMESLFDCAVHAVHPDSCLAAHLPTDTVRGRTIILAAGKAAAAMATVTLAALEAEKRADRLEGLVVTRGGHLAGQLPGTIEVIEAGHPVPDTMSRAAAPRMLALAESAREEDRIIALISGGASALLAAPADGISFSDKQQLTRHLLHSGATISEINCVRKHLSSIKGGRLAQAAAPAALFSFIISDVPGDDPADVASGPTVGDSSCLADARDILQKYHWPAGGSVGAALENPANESLFPGDSAFQRASTKIVARAADALASAARLARKQGWQPVILGDALEGIAHTLGMEHGALACRYKQKGGRWAIISGGETTVEVKNSAGRGGRNLEYLAGLAISLDGEPGISALACDTDGIDGTEAVAGATICDDFTVKCRQKGLDPARFLADNDTYGLFERVGGLVTRGPTLTNVNDFRVILVEG